MLLLPEFFRTVLVAGEGDLTASIVVCLLNAGHEVILSTKFPEETADSLNRHIDTQKAHTHFEVDLSHLRIQSTYDQTAHAGIVILITPENILQKQLLITEITAAFSADTLVCINAESIGLSDLQQKAAHPQRLLGLNWAEPAHTTSFLEIIFTDKSKENANRLQKLAADFWNKDPYTVNGIALRSRLFSALAREAAFLVENEYASIEDIDRACRNDAGYYLPFCGNCRYMDLMGTYAYGLVMKDLNPDLSKQKHLPEDMLSKMRSGDAFYDYGEGGIDAWKASTEHFSYQIRSIMDKYPFSFDDINSPQQT